MKGQDEEKNTPLYQALINLPIDNICHSECERLINEEDTIDVFATTTIAWEIFKPVNG